MADPAQREADFTAVLLDVVGLTAQQCNRMTQNGIVVIDDITLLDEETLMDVFPTTGQGLLMAMPKMKLKSLRTWALTKLQELNNNAELNVTDFNVAMCRKIQHKLATQKVGDKSETTKPTFSGTLETFNGRAKDWDKSNRMFLSYLGQQRGVSNIPLLYVVRIEADRPENLDEIQEDIWTAPLQGTHFERDNFTVYQVMKQWTANGVATSYVDRYHETNDGRSAYLLLHANYEGDDAIQTAITKAREVIHTTKYNMGEEKHKGSTFDDYCNKHQAANLELARRKVPYDGISQVNAFLQGIVDRDFLSIKSTILNTEETRSNLDNAIKRFKLQAGMLHQIGLQAPNQRNPRKISAQHNGGRRGNKYHNSNHGNRNSKESGDGSYNGDQQNEDDDDDDGLYIPTKVIAGLNPLLQKMIFTGRDVLRAEQQSERPSAKRNREHNREKRQAKAARTETDTDDEDQTIVTRNATTANNSKSASSQFGQRSLNNRIS